MLTNVHLLDLLFTALTKAAGLQRAFGRQAEVVNATQGDPKSETWPEDEWCDWAQNVNLVHLPSCRPRAQVRTDVSGRAREPKCDGRQSYNPQVGLNPVEGCYIDCLLLHRLQDSMKELNVGPLVTRVAATAGALRRQDRLLSLRGVLNVLSSTHPATFSLSLFLPLSA